MKISPANYQLIKDEIRQVAKILGINLETGANQGKTGLATMWDVFHWANRDRAYDDNHPSFAKGFWTRYLPYSGRKYAWYYGEKGNELDDTHIETALRRIKSELIEESRQIKG